MGKTASKAQLIAILKESSEVFRYCSKHLKILSTLSWGAKTAHEFFEKKAAELPNVEYAVDRTKINELIQALEKLTPKIKGEHPVFKWLLKTNESYILGAKLLLEVKGPQFFEISTQLYGNSKSKLFNGKTSNLDLANSISNRMSVCNLTDLTASRPVKTAEEFALEITAHIKSRKPSIPVRVEISDDISAKVVAGMNRVRVRRDARFSTIDVSALWNHEIESHCLTANNGILQENCSFLCSGGPRTTMTQEGLAVFFEMYGHSMSQRRFLAICDRVHAVELVESGADFIQLYRWYRERSDTDMEAFFAASRIFRGTNLKGGAPFTKDVVYVGGLLGLFSFLQIAVKNQNRLLVESLIAGRIALEDVGTIAWLRTHGIIEPPKYVPRWLENWESLLSFFSFSAFLSSVDIGDYHSYFDDNTFQDWDMSL